MSPLYSKQFALILNSASERKCYRRLLWTVKAVSSGVLTVEAKEISLKRTIAIYMAEIRNEEGALVASYQAKMFRKE